MKGQVSLEFVVLMVFMLVLFTGLFVALQGRMLAMRELKDMQTMQQLGNLVENEVRLAYLVGDGYERQFFVPVTLNGKSYDIRVDDQWDLIVAHHDLEHIAFLENQVTGAVQKGNNIVKNVHGQVELNS
ncbi:hypothetical protein ACFL1B_05935 [Nanoarchaeota archaeon]